MSLNNDNDDIYEFRVVSRDDDYSAINVFWWDIDNKKEKLIGKIWDNYEKNPHPLIKTGWKIIDKLADLINWFETKTKRYKQCKEVIDKI